VTGRWFPPGSPVSSTNKTDHYDMNEILLKVAEHTINQPTKPFKLEMTYNHHLKMVPTYVQQDY
jgi:hypothetical protein